MNFQPKLFKASQTCAICTTRSKNGWYKLSKTTIVSSEWTLKGFKKSKRNWDRFLISRKRWNYLTMKCRRLEFQIMISIKWSISSNKNYLFLYTTIYVKALMLYRVNFCHSLKYLRRKNFLSFSITTRRVQGLGLISRILVIEFVNMDISSEIWVEDFSPLFMERLKTIGLKWLTVYLLS